MVQNKHWQDNKLRTAGGVEEPLQKKDEPKQLFRLAHRSPVSSSLYGGKPF